MDTKRGNATVDYNSTFEPEISSLLKFKLCTILGHLDCQRPGQFYSTLANLVIFRTIFTGDNFGCKMLEVNDKVLELGKIEW